jgi:hypothetical protein
MNRTLIALITGAIVGVLVPACLTRCGIDSKKAEEHSEAVCYGQLRPICEIGTRPICICSGAIGQDCHYECR